MDEISKIKDATMKNGDQKGKEKVMEKQNSLSDRFLEEFDKCSICARDLEDPVLLPCLHSYCKRCVDKNMKGNGGKLICAACGESRDQSAQEVDPADLVPNTFVEHIRCIMAAEKASRRDGNHLQNSNKEIDLTKILCSSCGRGNPASRRCEDCRDFLCKTCVKVHKAVKILKDHDLIKLEEWMSAKQRLDVRRQTEQPGEVHCREHVDEIVKQFCITCGKLVCVDCIELRHKDQNKHERKSIAEAAAAMKTDIEKDLVETQQTAAKFSGALDILETTRSELKADAERLCGEVKAAIDNERETMDEREREYLDKIGDSEKANDTEIEKFVDKAEETLEHLTNASEFAESLLDIGDDYQVLNLSRTIQRRLKILNKEQPVLPPRLDDLGVIDLSHVTEEEDVPDTAPPLEDIPEVLEEEVKKVWSLESTIGSRGSNDGQFDWCRGICSSLDGHVAVADWGNDRAQIFDKEGRFFCQLNSDGSEEGKLSMPHDIACLRDGRYVCVDKSKFVRVYDSDGKFYHSFQTVSANETKDTRVELSCITVDRRNRILVGDCKRNAISVHYADGKLLQTFPAVGPAHLATDSKDRLIVSCSQKQKIRVMSPEGKLVFHIDRFGEEQGEKLKPQGLCCDDKDNIYVVHKERGGDKSVHIYDITGQYVTCVAKGLREPYDVTLLPTGRVVVADEDTVKVYMKRD